MVVIFMVLHIAHHGIHSNPAICFPNPKETQITSNSDLKAVQVDMV